MGWMRLSGVLVGLAVMSALFGGCAGRGSRVDVPVQGVRLPAEYGTKVHVTNWNGSVYVVADPRATEPRVTARVRPAGRGAPKSGQLPGTVSIAAHASIEGAERLLTVTSVPANEPPAPVAVDLYVRVPKSNGVQVKNSGGPVELVRVGGAIEVENGSPGRPGGDVQVRTGDAMTEPSTLITSTGKVLYQVGPGSTGRFNLMTDEGEVQFSSRLGEVREVRPEPTRWRGVLNDGANQVVLHSGKGLVRVHVIENAGEYGPELWDGWPVWPSEPKWLGRLGGYHNEEPPLGKRKATATQ